MRSEDNRRSKQLPHPAPEAARRPASCIALFPEKRDARTPAFVTIEIKILGSDDAAVLSRVADDVFDKPVRDEYVREFLNDSRHHMAAALDDGVVVGVVSALHYVHPDKPPELWINEVGVAPTHQRRGLASQLMRAIFAHGRTLGCREAWVLTERSNEAALGLYRSLEGEEPEDETVLFAFRLTDG
jgi:ribosomal protein S18 acetylase RimI-like enzyme